jgi:hypothetical protein
VAARQTNLPSCSAERTCPNTPQLAKEHNSTHPPCGPAAPTSQPSLNCRLQSAKPGEQVGAHVPPLQEPPEVPGLPAQVVPQAPQLVALVFRNTCDQSKQRGGGEPTRRQLMMLQVMCSPRPVQGHMHWSRNDPDIHAKPGQGLWHSPTAVRPTTNTIYHLRQGTAGGGTPSRSACIHASLCITAGGSTSTQQRKQCHVPAAASLTSQPSTAMVLQSAKPRWHARIEEH